MSGLLSTMCARARIGAPRVLRRVAVVGEHADLGRAAAVHDASAISCSSASWSCASAFVGNRYSARARRVADRIVLSTGAL